MKFALVGKNINYSISPEIHQEIFKKNQQDTSYGSLTYDIINCNNEEEFKKVLKDLKDGIYKGLNITTPFKEIALKYIENYNDFDVHYNSCNTLVSNGQEIFGFNTDIYGFEMMLKEYNLQDKKTFLIIGSGGAAKSCAYSLKQMGKTVLILTRQLSNAWTTEFSFYDYETFNNTDVQCDALDVIINATVLGGPNYIEKFPEIKYGTFENATFVDLNYKPEQTLFLKKGFDSHLNGMPMLFYQAFKAQEIFLKFHVYKNYHFILHEEYYKNDYLGSKYPFKIFAYSHEKEMILTVKSYPKGVYFNKDEVRKYLSRRRPHSQFETKRAEKDDIFILKGFNKEQISTGEDIIICCKNEDIIPRDYEFSQAFNRPGHADLVKEKVFNKPWLKYITQSGGGPFSGRITVLFVLYGVLMKFLNKNIEVSTQIIKIANDDVSMLSHEELENYIKKLDASDSFGAIIRLKAVNVKKGLGDIYFNRITQNVATFLLAIPGCRGLTFGDSLVLSSKGSMYNDLYKSDDMTITNHQAGINGGITNGNDLIVDVFLRPIASITRPQQTYNKQKKMMDTLVIPGRHDKFYVKRALVIYELMLLSAIINQG